MYWLRRGFILLSLLLAVSFVAWLVPRVLNPTKVTPEQRARDLQWVNSSPYFWDRQICRWISVCGLLHLRRDPAALPVPIVPFPSDDSQQPELRRRSSFDPATSWEDDGPSGVVDGNSKNRKRAENKKNRSSRERRRVRKDIPDYVLKHAPFVHLYSGEQFWPSDIREHIRHMRVTVNDVPLNSTEPWTLHNLHKLNQQSGTVVLHSNDDVETRPHWLHSNYNMPAPFSPDDDGDEDTGEDLADDGPDTRKEPTTWFDVDKDHPMHRIAEPRPANARGRVSSSDQQHQRRLFRRGHKPDASGYSRAPSVLVLVDKGSGILDAFWFFFYSYNLGQTVLGIRFGNHVGDWEHCMIRFENGVPRGLFFSEHEGGQAYAWEAVEKRGERPVIYSAVGSHAMYPLPGPHPFMFKKK